MNEIQQTIYEQIKSNRVKAFLGGFVSLPSDKSIIWRFLARARKNIKMFEIVYNEGEDLYEILFYTIRGDIVEHVKHVYADQLREIIESKLGLNIDF